MMQAHPLSAPPPSSSRGPGAEISEAVVGRDVLLTWFPNTLGLDEPSNIWWREAFGIVLGRRVFAKFLGKYFVLEIGSLT